MSLITNLTWHGRRRRVLPACSAPPAPPPDRSTWSISRNVLRAALVQSVPPGDRRKQLTGRSLLCVLRHLSTARHTLRAVQNSLPKCTAVQSFAHRQYCMPSCRHHSHHSRRDQCFSHRLSYFTRNTSPIRGSAFQNGDQPTAAQDGDQPTPGPYREERLNEESGRFEKSSILKQDVGQPPELNPSMQAQQKGKNYLLMNPVYTREYMESIVPKHRVPQGVRTKARDTGKGRLRRTPVRAPARCTLHPSQITALWAEHELARHAPHVTRPAPWGAHLYHCDFRIE